MGGPHERPSFRGPLRIRAYTFTHTKVSAEEAGTQASAQPTLAALEPYAAGALAADLHCCALHSCALRVLSKLASPWLRTFVCLGWTSSTFGTLPSRTAGTLSSPSSINLGLVAVINLTHHLQPAVRVRIFISSLCSR